MGAMSRRKGNRDMSEEMWLPVSACGGIYKENYMVSNHGRIWSKLTNKIINGGVNKRGYKHIGLRSGGERKNVNSYPFWYAQVISIPMRWVNKRCSSLSFINRLPVNIHPDRKRCYYCAMRFFAEWNHIMCKHLCLPFFLFWKSAKHAV